MKSNIVLRRFVLLIVFVFVCNICVVAQKKGNPSRLSYLQQKYSSVQYHPECGGWYFLSYQKNGQTLYGFADCAGNVIASDAYKYNIYKGYIELYIIDGQKKALHDQWKSDMTEYNRKMENYNRERAKYEAKLEEYNIKRSQAKEEAKRRYNKECKAAQDRANYENQRLAQQSSGASTGLAVLSAFAGALNTVTAATSVKFDPIFNQVLAERELLVAPAEPYNPRPTKPTEPSSGFYWKKFPLRQNANYSYVDYDKIKDGMGYANVKKGNKYGLVDAEFNVIVPCTSSKEVLKQVYPNGHCLIDVNGVYSIIDEDARKVIKSAEGIEVVNNNYSVKNAGKWSLYSFSGKKISKGDYDQIKSSEGHYICKEKGQWGVFTPDFRQLYNCKYQDAELVSLEGKKILLTKLNGQWGAVDFSTGRDIVPNNYASIKYNKNNSYLTVVKGDGKSGVYMTNGRMVIPSEYEGVEIKANGIEVKQGKTIGLYNASGIKMIPSGKYSSYKESSMGKYKVYEVKEGGLTGIVSPFGTEIIPCRYDKLTYSPEASVFIAESGNKRGVLACDGSVVIPFVENLSEHSVVNSLKHRNKPYILLEKYVKNKYKYGAVDFSGKTIVSMGKGKISAAEKGALKAVEKDANNSDVAKNAYAIIDNGAAKFNKEYGENLRKSGSFTHFAQNYVENVINDWQKKGEFEKSGDYQKRVNLASRQAKVLQLTTEAKEAYIALRSKELGADKLSIVGSYDADNETYRVKSKYSSEPLVIHVPSEHAQSFKSSFVVTSGKPQFFIENDDISLSGYTFVVDGRTYAYNSKNDLVYQVPDVEYSFDAIQIDKSAANLGGGGKKQKFSTAQFVTKSSDVDINIPVTTAEQRNTFAVIIANENYENEQNVPFAYHDGMIFKEYCNKTLGIPQQNIRFGNDLTANQMRNHINWMRETAKAFEGEARFIVYYVGHGMPNERTKDAYLLPSDGSSLDTSTGYKLSDLYATLGDMPAENVLVLLDACFSGAQRDGTMMQKGARGVSLAVNNVRPKGNVLVMSATSAKQTAWPYAEKSHGLFTYYILKKLQESKGQPVKMGEMFDYVKKRVSEKAIVVNNKPQIPTVTPSNSIMSSWKSLKI